MTVNEARPREQRPPGGGGGGGGRYGGGDTAAGVTVAAKRRLLANQSCLQTGAAEIRCFSGFALAAI